MEYIASSDAWNRFHSHIVEVLRMCNYRLHNGFMPWLLQYVNTIYSTGINSFLPRVDVKLHPALQNLPIIFITETDFNSDGKSNGYVIPCQDLDSIPERYLRKYKDSCYDYEDEFYFRDYPWEIDEQKSEIQPCEIGIPPETEFVSIQNYDEEIQRLINEGNIEDIETVTQPKYIFCKPDWLGIYYTYKSCFPHSIYIRIEKILENKLNVVGILSVVLHEIAHAIMDTPMHMPTSHIDELFFYVNEEAMANAFAYRTLCTRTLNKRHPFVMDVEAFMQLQPFEYTLGLIIAKAVDDFTIKSYLTNLCKAKYINKLSNPRVWFPRVHPRFWPQFDKAYVNDLRTIAFK